MNTTATATDTDTLTITRHIKAPRERVFAAFTNPEDITQWFGPGTVKVLECDVDFRVGGRYRFKVGCPTMEEDMVASGEYREIIEPSKIVHTWKWEDDEDWDNLESVVTFEFTAIGDETEVRLTHTGFPTEESRGNHTHGWTGCLEKLNATITGEPIPDFEPQHS